MLIQIILSNRDHLFDSVKWWLVLLFNSIYSADHCSFSCTHVSCCKYCNVSLAIQLNISYLFTQLNNRSSISNKSIFNMSHLFSHSLNVKFYLTNRMDPNRYNHSGSEKCSGDLRRLGKTCCHSNSSERPSANAGVKNSQGVTLYFEEKINFEFPQIHQTVNDKETYNISLGLAFFFLR